MKTENKYFRIFLWVGCIGGMPLVAEEPHKKEKYICKKRDDTEKQKFPQRLARGIAYVKLPGLPPAGETKQRKEGSNTSENDLPYQDEDTSESNLEDSQKKGGTEPKPSSFFSGTSSYRENK